MRDPTVLPDDLPEPTDDGAAQARFAERCARIFGLSTFDVDGMTLIRRVTLIVRDGVIGDVVYPVFPPDQGAELALARL